MFKQCSNLLIYRMSDVQHNRGTDYLLVQVVFQLLMLDLNLINCWINLAVEGPFFSIFFSTIFSCLYFL
jgi:hypothetical protein